MDPVDALILTEATGVAPGARRVVVVDDNTGALTRAAEVGHPSVAAYTDTPGASGGQDEQLPTMLAGADLVLLRLPKSLGALDEYAGLVAQHADPRVRLVAGGRVKHMTRGMNDVLARHFGEVRASLGVRKARVLHAATPLPGGGGPGWPRAQTHDDLGLVVMAHGACFGGTKIDPGTRLLLEAFDRAGLAGDGRTALDLGSGNGTIAALLARRGFAVSAIDNSRAAVASTRATAAANGVRVDARLGDGLTGVPDRSVDLIACNPPFHVGTAKDSSTALAMIADSARVLGPGGALWLVWNAHLPYLPALRRMGSTEIVARNPKFIVTRTGAR